MELPKRPDIEITAKKSFAQDVFTSGSVIRGIVLITPSHNIAVTAVEIFFTGVTKITLDSMDNFKSTKHKFLMLKMPPLYEYLPPNRVLVAGTTYKIPFDFIIPYRLSISVCIHKSNFDIVDKHTQLPPSSGNWGNNESVPGGTHISYTIHAEITRRRILGSESAMIDRACWPVNILPALPEDPPIDLAPDHGDSGICKTRFIRTSRFKRAIGSVTASIKQPRAIRLTGDGRGALGSYAEVHFLFRAFRAGATPPKISIASGKMASTTLHTSKASAQLPHDAHDEDYIYSYHSAHPIAYLPPDNAQWISRDLERGDNMSFCDSSTNSSIAQSSARLGMNDENSTPEVATEHTMSLRIPFTLLYKGPGFHLPTFHSCLISRIYTLKLNFAVGTTNSNISLAVPLQISVPPIYDSDALKPPSYDSIMCHEEQGETGLQCSASIIDRHLGIEQNMLLPEYDAAMR